MLNLNIILCTEKVLEYKALIKKNIVTKMFSYFGPNESMNCDLKVKR